MILSYRSENNLKGLHPHLVNVVRRAAEVIPHDAPVTFIVTEGLRTMQKQRQLLASGASNTLNSRHLTGHAFDIAVMVNGEVRWDWPLYEKMSEVILQAAKDVGVPLEWGGNWPKLRDGPHYQLPFYLYPKETKQ